MQKGKKRTQEVKNAVASISRFLSSVSEDGILCAEHTGAYGDLLVYLCNQMKVPIALVPGYTIKHSLGMVKGKSDPLDSKRIREYGERFTDKLIYAEYPEENITELKQLYTLRHQMVKQRKALRTLDKGKGHHKPIDKHLKPSAGFLEKTVPQSLLRDFHKK